jgi:hypothetical protein
MRPEPGKIIVAGDWHGNTAWACHVIERAAELLKDEEHKLILHAGDFGIWPGESGRDYVSALTAKLAALDVHVHFIDGNHEDFTQVSQFDPWMRMSEHPRIVHLPRGMRWTWHGQTWLALGGAVSVDKALRTEGVSWWPGECITLDQAAAAILDGPADVMLTHDAPLCAPVHLMEPPPIAWARVDLLKSWLHRSLLQDVMFHVKPSFLIHAHYHQAYQRVVSVPSITGHELDDIEITALNMDGQPGNWAVLDTRTMEWEWPG